MIRLLGSVCILGSGCLGIWLQMRDRRRRQETLRQLEGALWRMAEEVRMARTPMPLLLETLSTQCSGAVAHFFSQIAGAVRLGEPLRSAWRREAENLPLSHRDREVLRGVDLHVDEENFCNGILLARDCLARSAREQEQRAPEDGKRSAALWASAAALLVILLI